MLGMKVAHGIDNPGVLAVGRDEAQAGLDNILYVVVNKRLRDAACDELSAVDAVAPVRHAGHALCDLGRARGIARAHQPHAVDEDLAADLLGHAVAVLLDRARARRANTRAQVLVTGVLGGNAVSAPPEKPVLKRRVVEPGA